MENAIQVRLPPVAPVNAHGRSRRPSRATGDDGGTPGELAGVAAAGAAARRWAEVRVQADVLADVEAAGHVVHGDWRHAGDEQPLQAAAGAPRPGLQDGEEVAVEAAAGRRSCRRVDRDDRRPLPAARHRVARTRHPGRAIPAPTRSPRPRAAGRTIAQAPLWCFEAARVTIEAQPGLDKIFQQYVEWITRVGRGDFGDLLWRRVPAVPAVRRLTAVCSAHTIALFAVSDRRTSGSVLASRILRVGG